MTEDWRKIAIELRNALAASEKWWEHKELLERVDDLLQEPEQRTPIKWLGLCVRIENALLRNKCDTIEKLQKLRASQILSIRGLGQSSLPVIQASLRRWNSLPKQQEQTVSPSE